MKEIIPGTAVHRVHISAERHQVIAVNKNVVLVNERGYAYTFPINRFWNNYEVCK